MNQFSKQIIRRPKYFVSCYSINGFHLRNPWVIAWWSLAFPGFGHLACGNMAKGIFVFVGEIIINYMAKINMAILYSFVGDFEKAKVVLNTQWLLLYGGVLVFAIWDSYRLAVECNKLSVLGDRENASVAPLVIGSVSFNGLEKRNPWVSAVWSLLVPGSGQLYVTEAPKAIFLLLVSGFILIISHSFQALIYTVLGNFEQAKAVIDWQWFLNIPSFYVFAVWDAYVNAVEINKFFEIEQAQYFRNNFQSPDFKKPLP